MPETPGHNPEDEAVKKAAAETAKKAAEKTDKGAAAETTSKESAKTKAGLKSKRKTITRSDGTVEVESEEYYPDTVGAVERTEKESGAKPAVAEAPKEKPAEKAESAHKPEAPEKVKEAPVTGAAVVEAVKTDPETPKEIKDALHKPENANAAAAAVDNGSVFGEKTKNFFRRIGVGLVPVVARAGIKFWAKRTLDFGSVGAGIAAGAAVGGAVEGIKSYRAESKRLYDLDTYKDALAGYKHMTNLDKVTAIIALETRLKDKFRNKTLKPAEHVKMQAQLNDLRANLEQVTGVDSEHSGDAEKVKNLLKFRDPGKQAPEDLKLKDKALKYLSDVAANFKSLKKEDFKDKEFFEQGTKLVSLLKTRSKVDRQGLKDEQTAEVKKLLEQFYKERGLNRNVKKIAWETTKGAVFGAAGGALGAWAFEHVADFAASHGYIPEGWVTGHSGGGHGATAEHINGHGPGGSPDASHAGGGHGAPVSIEHAPGADDVQILHKTVWDTCKQYMIDHGVAHPSNHDVNEAMIRICKENGIEISGHHDIADFKGFHHEHFEKLIDVKLHNGMQLHGFGKLTDLINHAGGHVQAGPEFTIPTQAEIGAQSLASVKAQALEQMAHTSKEMAEQQKHLSHIMALFKDAGEVATAGAVGYVGYKAVKRYKKEVAEPKQPELIGHEQELKTAGLEQRLEVLNDIKIEVFKHIAEARKYLEGKKPNPEAFTKYLKDLDKSILSEQQFQRLVLGASEEDSKKIGESWNKLIDELNVVVKPLEDKAEELKQEIENQKVGETNPDDDYDDDLPDISKGFLNLNDRPKRKTAKAEKLAGFGEAERNFKEQIKQGGTALNKGSIDEATKYHLEAALALSALSLSVKKLTGKDRKNADEGVESLQTELDALGEKIDQAKKTKEKPATTTKTQDKAERETEAARLGMEVSQLPYYNKMVRLGIVTPQPDGAFSPDQKSGNRVRLNKFITLTKENASIFRDISKGGSETLRSGFLSALDKLKLGNDSGPLKEFCVKLMEKGQSLNKYAEAQKILGVMQDISGEISLVIEQARAEFKLKAKK